MFDFALRLDSEKAGTVGEPDSDSAPTTCDIGGKPELDNSEKKSQTAIAAIVAIVEGVQCNSCAIVRELCDCNSIDAIVR